VLVSAAPAVCLCCLPAAAVCQLLLLSAGQKSPALHAIQPPASQHGGSSTHILQGMRAHCSRGVCCVSQHSLAKGGPPTLAPLQCHTAVPVQLCASPGLEHACFRPAQLLRGSPVQAAVLAGCVRRGMELCVV
jgi:hypothetical protein